MDDKTKQRLLDKIQYDKTHTCSLRELTYTFIKKTGLNSDFNNLDYEEIMNAGKNGNDDYTASYCNSILESEYKKIQSDLLDIFQIFGIIRFIDEWKENGEYVFWHNEVETIIILIQEYRESPWWKKIKSINNSNFDGFVKAYIDNRYADELFNLIFDTVNYLGKMYVERNYNNDEKVEEFTNTLIATTQIYQIQWLQVMDKRIKSMPVLSKEDINSPIGDVLLYQYEIRMQKLTDLMLVVMELEAQQWENIKQYCWDRYYDVASAIDNIRYDFLEYAMRDYLRENDEEVAELFDEVCDENGSLNNLICNKSSRKKERNHAAEIKKKLAQTFWEQD